MVSDDACSTVAELLKKLMDIIGSIERDIHRNGLPPKNNASKVKVGKLSKKDFEKLQQSGTSFKYLTIPADKQKEIEETVKKMGGSYFDAHLGDNNNHVIAVPASQLDLVNMAIKHVVAKELADNGAISVKDGSELIPEEDMPLIKDILNKYDIPVVSFKTDDDMYMNIVPKEFEGQYAEAMKEAECIKKQMDNIDVVRYDQTAPLDDPDKLAEVVSIDGAEALAADNLDIEFVKQQEEDKVAILYKAKEAERVNKAREEYSQSLENSEDYIIDIMDNIITLDIDKLMIPELCDNESFFMKVPNTLGQDFIRIDRADAEIVNNGKTIKTTLDFEKEYHVYDTNGGIRRKETGMELAKYFLTKNLRVNEQTKVYKYGTNGKELRRIDLFSKSKNELVSIKLDNAENVRVALRDHGLSYKAAEKLLADINKELTPEQKGKFQYTATKPEIIYADVPNIGEYLAQTQLSKEVVMRAECIGELPKDTGPKCCVHDKNTNKYTVIPVSAIGEVRAQLAALGYAENAVRELANKIVSHYRETDEVKETSTPVESTPLKRFDGQNAELESMKYYNFGDKALVIRETEEDFHYMQIEKETPFADVEKVLREDFGIVDDISVAIAVKQMQRENIIPESKQKESKEAEISQVTSNVIEVTCKETGKSVMVNMMGIDSDSLYKIGLTFKAVNDIKKSFDKSISDVKHPKKKQTLSFIKSKAEKKAIEVAAAEKNQGNPEIGKGDER